MAINRYLIALILLITASTQSFCQQGNQSIPGGGGITTVTSLPATCTPGTTAPVNLNLPPPAGGIYVCSVANTWTPDNPNQAISPLAYGAKWDVKYVYDAGMASGGSIVTCPQNDCAFTSADVGKLAFLTLSPNIGSSITGGLIVPAAGTAACTIQTVNSASSVTLTGTGCTAGSTCTASGATLCDFVWGTQDDTTAINNAAIAAYETPGKCFTLQFPSGTAFVSGAIVTMQTAVMSSACGGSAGALTQSGIDTTQTGPELLGMGPGSTVLVPLPNFSFTNCNADSSNPCFFAVPNLAVHDLGINGFNQNITNASTSTLVELKASSGGGACTGSTGFNLTFSFWQVNQQNTVGFLAGNGCGDPTYNNIISEQFGGTNCSLTAGLVAQFSAITCFGTNFIPLLINCSNINEIVNTYASEFVDQNSSGPTVEQTGCTWNSNGDYFNNPTSTGSSTIFFMNASVPANVNFQGATFQMGGNTGTSQVFLSNSGVAGSIIHIRNSKISLSSGANNRLMSVNSNTQFFDDGSGLQLNGSTPAVTSSIAGDFIADGHSLKGICTGTATASQTLGLYGTGPNETLTTCTSTTIGSGVPSPGARTLFGLNVKAATGGALAGSGVFTVLKNGAGTAITCTVGTGTTCTDFIHSVATADGDLISIQYTTQAGETLAGIKALVDWN